LTFDWWKHFLKILRRSEVTINLTRRLKKIAPSGGRRENFWGISCEKSLFYAKKSFFPIAEGGAKIFGVFRVKNHDFTPNKIIFSPILGGGGARAGCAPRWIRPCNYIYY
jgi:hypothetical protein